MNNQTVSKPMRCKAYNVVIELEIQAVTCPGVWLCNNGKVTIHMSLLGLNTQTSAMSPVFPLLCHEKFIFRKCYPNIQTLTNIDKKLSRELVYMELVQWENYEISNILATFSTTLTDLLYPYKSSKGIVAGVDVDLLMEATKIFPGIIAPKVEVSTKFTLEEILCTIKEDKRNNVIVVNPKLLSSKSVPKRDVPVHQKKVCHNDKFHKCVALKTEPEDIKMRRIKAGMSKEKDYCIDQKLNQEYPRDKEQPIKTCNCCGDNKRNRYYSPASPDYEYPRNSNAKKSFKHDSPINQDACCYKNKGDAIACDLCTKYKFYFSSDNNCHYQNFTDPSQPPIRLCNCKKSKTKLKGDFSPVNSICRNARFSEKIFKYLSKNYATQKWMLKKK